MILTWTLTKILKVGESKSFEFRREAFNAFSDAQFDGAAAVDGEVNDPHFGEVVSAAPETGTTRSQIFFLRVGLFNRLFLLHCGAIPSTGLSPG
jgi:hypothetical protein